jgi:hypothetical protein
MTDSDALAVVLKAIAGDVTAVRVRESTVVAVEDVEGELPPIAEEAETVQAGCAHLHQLIFNNRMLMSPRHTGSLPPCC